MQRGQIAKTRIWGRAEVAPPFLFCSPLCITFFFFFFFCVMLSIQWSQ